MFDLETMALHLSSVVAQCVGLGCTTNLYCWLKLVPLLDDEAIAKIKDNNRSVRNVFVRVSISPEEYKYIRIKRLKKLTMRVVSCTCTTNN